MKRIKYLIHIIYMLKQAAGVETIKELDDVLTKFYIKNTDINIIQESKIKQFFNEYGQTIAYTILSGVIVMLGIYSTLITMIALDLI